MTGTTRTSVSKMRSVARGRVMAGEPILAFRVQDTVCDGPLVRVASAVNPVTLTPCPPLCLKPMNRCAPSCFVALLAGIGCEVGVLAATPLQIRPVGDRPEGFQRVFDRQVEVLVWRFTRPVRSLRQNFCTRQEYWHSIWIMTQTVNPTTRA